MNDIIKRDLERFFSKLPIGILVIDTGFAELYSNAKYQQIMALGADEYGSWQNAHKLFLKDASKYRRRKESVVRFLNQENDASTVVSVYQSALAVRDQACIVISLIARGRDRVAQIDLPPEVYISGLLRINFANRTVYYGRKLLKLSDIEYRLLDYFCRNEDRLLSKQELLKNVWGKRSSATRTVDVYVTRLRQKLREAGVKKERIETLHGQGYVWTPI